VRPSDISSTDDEKEAARIVAAQIKKYLKTLGWSDPVVADSGNGYHLLYRVDLPNDDEGRARIESVLKALAARFDNSAVKIDQKVFNASRITKAYGTLACKGDSIPERPHRLSGMFKPPAVIEPVAKELLVALAADAPKPEKRNSGATETGTGGGWTEKLVEQILDRASTAAMRWITRACKNGSITALPTPITGNRTPSRSSTQTATPTITAPTTLAASLKMPTGANSGKSARARAIRSQTGANSQTKY
jgi:hypothetical protein